MIGDKQRGEKGWWFGKHRSQETKDAISRRWKGVAKENNGKSFDKNLYLWKHSIFGIFVGSKEEIILQFPEQNLIMKRLYCIPTKKAKEYNGWSIIFN